MAAKRTSGTGAADRVTRIAEGIGEALAGLVNRLEKIEKIDTLGDARARAYAQLLELQRRVNEQVTRFGRSLRPSGGTASAGGARRRQGTVPRANRPGAPTTARPTAARAPRSRSGPKKSKKSETSKKREVTCSVCGALGHNARGHARWQAARG